MYWAIIAFFVLEYIRPSDDFPILQVIKINTIYPITLFIISLLLSTKISINKIINNHNLWLLLSYLFLFAISIYTARLSFNAFNVFKGVLGYILIFFILVKNIDSLSKLKAILITLALIHIFVLMRNPEVVLDPSVRHFLDAGYFFGDGNDFALSVNIVIPFVLLLYIIQKKKYGNYSG